jgi:hypothetical protein
VLFSVFSFLLENAMRQNEYASWEKSYGYTSDSFLKNEPPRAGQFQIKKRQSSSDEVLFTRMQWQARKRRVLSGVQPMKTIETRAGHILRLFTFEQTIEQTEPIDGPENG